MNLPIRNAIACMHEAPSILESRRISRSNILSICPGTGKYVLTDIYAFINTYMFPLTSLRRKKVRWFYGIPV